MVLLTQSREIKEFLASVNTEKISIEDSVQVIDHTELVRLLKQQTKHTLTSLIKTTTVYHKPLPKRIPSPEYIKLMNHYKLLAEEREYKEMTNKYEKEFTPSEWKTVNSLMVSIFNVFFSVGAVFVATFMLGEYAGVDIAIKVLMALAMSAIVLVAEGWFFTRDWISTKV
ncbi:hypothetical protein HK103_005355 [Boothiomyces macroporosus]|uniref:Uncharacterized protein n=1 Tax=Boothiomyces macroporosus TaxID=261099 RepID=A0AAD5Y6K1_9FUNG|nr:hypothetical protein HK103_005355 [Boothiomyces macroporosus]